MNEKPETQKPKIAECTRCGYKWVTKSQHYTTACPSCRYTVVLKPIPKKKKEVELIEQPTKRP